MSYVATGLPATLCFVAGYQTSTGALSVGRVNVVSPTPKGPGAVKLLGPRRATVGTVSPWTTLVPATAAARAGGAGRTNPARTVRAAAAAAPRRTDLFSMCLVPPPVAPQEGRR